MCLFWWVIIFSANSIAPDCEGVCHSSEVCFLEGIWGIYWISLCSQRATGKPLTVILDAIYHFQSMFSLSTEIEDRSTYRCIIGLVLLRAVLFGVSSLDKHMQYLILLLNFKRFLPEVLYYILFRYDLHIGPGSSLSRQW